MNITTLLLFAIFCVAIWYVAYHVGLNKSHIRDLHGVTTSNNGLIIQNQKLIHLIYLMIENSNIEVDWDKYAKAAKAYGVDVNDTFRNQDIYNPEG